MLYFSRKSRQAGHVTAIPIFGSYINCTAQGLTLSLPFQTAFEINYYFILFYLKWARTGPDERRDVAVRRESCWQMQHEATVH